MAIQPFCSCMVRESSVARNDHSVNGRTFRFQFMWGSSPNFKWKDYTRDQSLVLMRKAMNELSGVSGAKFVEVNTKPQIKMYFTKVPYDALGAYMGDGKIYFSQTRFVNDRIINTCVQHEVGHYLGIRAVPSADKWGHCPDKICHMNIDAGGTQWCAKCRQQLVKKIGA